MLSIDCDKGRNDKWVLVKKTSHQIDSKKWNFSHTHLVSFFYKEILQDTSFLKIKWESVILKDVAISWSFHILHRKLDPWHIGISILSR